MFRRLRETSKILSYKEKPGRPDVVYGASLEPQPTRFSGAIAWLIEVAALGIVVILGASVVNAIVDILFPADQPSFLSRVVIGAASLSLTGVGIYYLHKLNHKIQLRLRIAEKVEPYFGHKLEESYRILKS